MKLDELYKFIHPSTDVDVVRGCCIIKKIKRGTYWEDIDYDMRNCLVKSITAVNYRTIEVTIGGKEY